MAAGKEKPNFKVVADNRRARYDYEIGEMRKRTNHRGGDLPRR